MKNKLGELVFVFGCITADVLQNLS